MGPKFDPNEIKYIYLRAVGGEVGQRGWRQARRCGCRRGDPVQDGIQSHGAFVLVMALEGLARALH